MASNEARKKPQPKKANQDLFLTEYINNGRNAHAACKTIGIQNSTFYRWKNKDPEFRAKLEEREKAVQVVADSFYDRIRKNAERCVEQASSFDPDTALEVLAMLDPEKWDKAIRKAAYERSLQTSKAAEPTKIVYKPEALPERLLSKPEDKAKES